MNTGFTDLEIRSLAIDSEDNIFAGNIDGVYRSTNNGNIWTKMGLNEVVSAFTVNSLNHIYASDFGGYVYISTDKVSVGLKKMLHIIYNLFYKFPEIIFLPVH